MLLLRATRLRLTTGIRSSRYGRHLLTQRTTEDRRTGTCSTFCSVASLACPWRSVGLLALKVLDTFAADDLPAPVRNDASRLHEIESREDALVDSFFNPPVK